MPFVLFPEHGRSTLAVLVVGGAGYVGSRAAHTLRRHGHEVIVYDNLSFANLKQ